MKYGGVEAFAFGDCLESAAYDAVLDRQLRGAPQLHHMRMEVFPTDIIRGIYRETRDEMKGIRDALGT